MGQNVLPTPQQMDRASVNQSRREIRVEPKRARQGRQVLGYKFAILMSDLSILRTLLQILNPVYYILSAADSVKQVNPQ
jgi:hypothetical protein